MADQNPLAWIAFIKHHLTLKLIHHIKINITKEPLRCTIYKKNGITIYMNGISNASVPVCLFNIQCSAVIMRSIFLPNPHKIHPIARPMYFVDSNSDLYSASVTAVMYVISCYTGPRYNGTQLYRCHIEGILPKGPYPPFVSMAGRALLAGYHRYYQYRNYHYKLYRCHFINMGITVIKVSHAHLIFIMRIPMPEKFLYWNRT